MWIKRGTRPKASVGLGELGQVNAGGDPRPPRHPGRIREAGPHARIDGEASRSPVSQR